MPVAFPAVARFAHAAKDERGAGRQVLSRETHAWCPGERSVPCAHQSCARGPPEAATLLRSAIGPRPSAGHRDSLDEWCVRRSRVCCVGCTVVGTRLFHRSVGWQCGNASSPVVLLARLGQQHTEVHPLCLGQCDSVKKHGSCPARETKRGVTLDKDKGPGVPNDGGVPVCPSIFPPNLSPFPFLPPPRPSGSSWRTLSPHHLPPRCATKDCLLSCALSRRTSWPQERHPASSRSATGAWRPPTTLYMHALLPILLFLYSRDSHHLYSPSSSGRQSL